MHDSRMFLRLRLGQSFQPDSHDINGFFLGWWCWLGNVQILLPYPLAVEPENHWFNCIQSPHSGGQAFGHLKNPFWILLHAQNALPIRPRNTTCVCMILHNLLNWRGTLYLQDWEACTSAEILLAELPCEASNSTTNPDISEGSVVSCTLKEIFSKTFCIYLKSNTLLLPIQSFIDCPVGFSHHHTSEAWHI